MTLGGDWSEIDLGPDVYDDLPEGASPNWTATDESGWLDKYGGLDGATPAFTIIDEIDFNDGTWIVDTKPYLCKKCGSPVGGDGSTETPCRAGNCWEIRCRQCGFHWAGFGPVGCPCQSRDPKIRRIRQMYRARKR